MDLIENLEYNKPIIKTSIDNISIKTSTMTEVLFTIENLGGGVLQGEIFCDDKYIFVNKNIFNGNVNISCIIDVKNFSYGDFITTDITILSNGGDVVIPTTIQVTKDFFLTRSGVKIYTLKEFVKYYFANPLEGKSIFYSEKFEHFIMKINSSYKGIYNSVKNDDVAERGIENFFLMLNLKEQCKIVIDSYKEIEILPLEENNYNGIIELKKIGNGYVSGNLQVNCNWFKLLKYTVTDNDFDEYGYCQIEYTIDTKLIKNSVSQCLITIDEENKMIFKVRKNNFAKISVDKEVFNNREKAFIHIENLCSKPLTFNISTNNSNIILEEKTVIVNDKIDILFSIKLTPVELGRVAVLKQPYFESKIKVVAVAEDIKLTKEIPVTIGTKSLELK